MKSNRNSKRKPARTRRKIVFLKDEKWKTIVVNQASRKKYAVSNYGRIMSYDVEKNDGMLLQTRYTQRYPSISFRGTHGANLNYYMHRLVAQLFVTKKSPRHNFVIHLDHNKENNRSANLRWVTLSEQMAHAKNDPNVIRHLNPSVGAKLNAKKVREIKKMFNSKTKVTLRVIARRYKVSDMQIHRIRTGENWGHIKD